MADVEQLRQFAILLVDLIELENEEEIIEDEKQGIRFCKHCGARVAFHSKNLVNHYSECKFETKREIISEMRYFLKD